MNPLPRPARPLAVLVLAAAVSLSAAGCASDPVAESDSRAVPASTTPGTSAPTTDAATDDAADDATDDASAEVVVQPEDPACAPGPGKLVEPLDDVTIAAYSVPDVVVPDETIGDVVVPGFRVPGFSLPETVVKGGCIVRHDAPGACLGAVEITGVELPDVRIPGAAIPPVVVDGEVLFEGQTASGALASGAAAGAESAEQTCQEQPAESGDDFIGSVFRPSLFRASLFRASLFRSSMLRPAVCVEVDGGQECTDSVRVDSRRVDSVRVDSVRVDSARLPSYRVEGAPETTVFTDETEQAYVTPAEVLFDFDEAVVKPDAAGSLAAIAAEVVAAGPGASVVVEGHTDDQGTDAYNENLSEQRAAAVALWLSEQGGIAATSITTEGYGESVPVASNETDEDRAKNRRVVIAVTVP